MANFGPTRILSTSCLTPSFGTLQRWNQYGDEFFQEVIKSAIISKERNQGSPIEPWQWDDVEDLIKQIASVQANPWFTIGLAQVTVSHAPLEMHLTTLTPAHLLRDDTLLFSSIWISNNTYIRVNLDIDIHNVSVYVI